MRATLEFLSRGGYLYARNLRIDIEISVCLFAHAAPTMEFHIPTQGVLTPEGGVSMRTSNRLQRIFIITALIFSVGVNPTFAA
jgi:hypothetical protein